MPPPLFCYDFPRPAVTVDMVVLAHEASEVVALMVRRGHEPFAGSWAIPGGFLDMDEEVEIAVRRELKEETGLHLWVPISFLGIFATPGRDPRGRTVSLVYTAYLPGKPPEVFAGDDAAEACWRPARPGDPATPLAFDHDEILQKGLDWLNGLDRIDQAGKLNPSDQPR